MINCGMGKLATAFEISLLLSYRPATGGTAFTINQYPVKIMEGFMTDNRNIIVVKGDEDKFFIKKRPVCSPQMYFILLEDRSFYFDYYR
jgi:hypothetical protein